MLIATVKSTDLVAGLEKVTRIVGKNPILPVLEAVHVRTTAKGLVLTTTNLEATIQTGIPAKVAEKNKDFLIPDRAQSILMELPECDVEIINGQGLTFKCGSHVFKTCAEDTQNFPAMPSVGDEPVVVEVEDHSAFGGLLSMHKEFLSSDDLRPAMGGIYVTNKVMASTNAHLLCVSSVKALPYKSETAFKTIVPKSFLVGFKAIEDSFKLKVGSGHIQVTDKQTKVICRAIDANFPDYAVVIPKDNGLHIALDRVELLNTARLAMKMSNRQTNQLTFDFVNGEDGNGTYTLNATDIDFGEEAIVKNPCRWKENNGVGEFKIAFNGKFLLSILQQMSDKEITLKMSRPSCAAILQEKGNLFLIMPLMLNL